MAVVFDSFKPLSYHILYKRLLFCYLSKIYSSYGT
nr:MAG TPA: hypothetical protein [Caudoviricetes sp.]